MQADPDRTVGNRAACQIADEGPLDRETVRTGPTIGYSANSMPRGPRTTDQVGPAGVAGAVGCVLERSTIIAWLAIELELERDVEIGCGPSGHAKTGLRAE